MRRMHLENCSIVQRQTNCPIQRRGPSACPPFRVDQAAEEYLLRRVSRSLSADNRGHPQDIVGFTGVRRKHKVRADGEPVRHGDIEMTASKIRYPIHGSIRIASIRQCKVPLRGHRIRGDLFMRQLTNEFAVPLVSEYPVCGSPVGAASQRILISASLLLHWRPRGRVDLSSASAAYSWGRQRGLH
jgi:hypothetical protein